MLQHTVTFMCNLYKLFDFEGDILYNGYTIKGSGALTSTQL